MADKAIEPGKKSTERYLPEKAWAASKADRKKTDDKKKRESRKGKQFVNTDTARKARKAVSKAEKRKMGQKIMQDLRPNTELKNKPSSSFIIETWIQQKEH